MRFRVWKAAAIAAIFAAAACTEEKENGLSTPGSRLIAGLEAPDGTRVAFDDSGTFTWSDGDAVAGDALPGKAAVVDLAAAAGGAVAFEQGALRPVPFRETQRERRALLKGRRHIAPVAADNALAPALTGFARGRESARRLRADRDQAEAPAQSVKRLRRQGVVPAAVLAVKAHEAGAYKQDFHSAYLRMLRPRKAPQRPPMMCVSWETLSARVTPLTTSPPT